ncbi:hypothetical protein ACFE04_008956 [Oxalis oulophora]
MASIGYLEITLAFISFFILCYWRKNRKSPVIITNWPIFGMLPGLLYNGLHFHEYACKVMTQSGCTFEFEGPPFKFLKLNFFATCDPVNVSHILSRNFVNYEKGSEYKEIFEPFGDGIFRSDSELWKFHRKSIHSWISNGNYESALEKIVWKKLMKGLVPILEHFAVQGKKFDFQDLVQRFTFDNVCLLFLGYDPNSLSVELPEFEYEKAIHVIEESVVYRHMIPKIVWKLQSWLQVGHEKKVKLAREVLDEFIYKCIHISKENLLKREEENFDFLTFFLNSTGEEEYIDGRKLKSDKFIRDVTFNLMIAGRDTMSSCLCWFFWLVATHPDVETKILEEINLNLSKIKDRNNSDRLFTTQELQSKFTYLHATLFETLRLYPSVPINSYTAIKADTTPTGHPLDPGTRILIPFYSMGRMQSIWGEDCLEFKPERFISEQKGSLKNVPSYKFTAFNLGSRACVGKDTSLVQMKMVAIAVLKNFQTKVSEGNNNVSPSNSVILHMRSSLKVTIAKRSSVP